MARYARPLMFVSIKLSPARSDNNGAELHQLIQGLPGFNKLTVPSSRRLIRTPGRPLRSNSRKRNTNKRACTTGPPHGCDLIREGRGSLCGPGTSASHALNVAHDSTLSTADRPGQAPRRNLANLALSTSSRSRAWGSKAGGSRGRFASLF